MEEEEYESATANYNKAIKLFSKHRFEAYNEKTLNQNLKDAASSYAEVKYYESIKENRVDLETLKEIKEAINHWILQYKLPAPTSLVGCVFLCRDYSRDTNQKCKDKVLHKLKMLKG